MKFKRVNALNYRKENNMPYDLANVLRQTSIKNLVDMANKKGLTKEEFKAIVLSQVNNLLDEMIVEKENLK